MTRRDGLALVLSIFLLVAVVPATPVQAACAADPNALSFRDMIKKNKTGIPSYDHFFVGRVVDIKDLEPGKGGEKLAKLAVAESPVGYAPLVARVHFWKPESGGGPTPVGDLHYHRRHFYAVIGERLKDGTFADDAGECGRTVEIGHDRFWNLVRFVRHH